MSTSAAEPRCHCQESTAALPQGQHHPYCPMVWTPTNPQTYGVSSQQDDGWRPITDSGPPEMMWVLLSVRGVTYMGRRSWKVVGDARVRLTKWESVWLDELYEPNAWQFMPRPKP